MYFPTAGIECSPLVPFAAALGVSFFTSMGGVSGAFLLLPFQMSVLGYTNPSVSATNQFFNVLACPAGVWRYWREGRLLWPLTLMVALGTLPGVFAGTLIRINLLPDPRHRPHGSACRVLSWNSRLLTFCFQEQEYRIACRGIALLSLVVGLVGGVYGIGGGAIMAPFLVSFFGLPVHAVAGASLFATLLTSVAGVVFYSLLAPLYSGLAVAPDWRLGLLLGLGGMAGR